MGCAVMVRGGRWSSLAAASALLLSAAAAPAVSAVAADGSTPAVAASAAASRSVAAAQGGSCRHLSIRDSVWEPHVRRLVALGVITEDDDFTAADSAGACEFEPGE